MKKIGIWPFSFYFLQFAGFATIGPFLVLYYQELGFSGMQLGLLTGIAPLVTFASAPAWTRIADRTGMNRLLMSIALMAGIGVLIVFPFLSTFAAVLTISMLLNVFLAPITPFADNATMFMLGEQKQLYGRVRLGGTVGYGIAASVAGILVDRFGIGSAFWGCAALFSLAWIVSQRFVHGKPGNHPSGKEGGTLHALLENPRWLLFLIVAFAAGVSLASFNYLFPYMKGIGAPTSMMGLALTIGTLVEIPALFFAHRLITRYTSYTVLMFGMVVMGARLLLYAATGIPVLVLVIQVLNGLSFPLVLVAGVSYANEKAPNGLTTTAQGVFGAMVYGIGMAAGGFMGGPLLERVGGRGLFLVFGVLVLVILAIVTLLERRLPAEATPSDVALP